MLVATLCGVQQEYISSCSQDHIFVLPISFKVKVAITICCKEERGIPIPSERTHTLSLSLNAYIYIYMYREEAGSRERGRLPHLFSSGGGHPQML